MSKDLLARVWSLFVGMLGGAAIVAALVFGYSVFSDGGNNGVEAAGAPPPTSVTSTDPGPAPTTTVAAPTAPADTTPATAPGTLGAQGNAAPIAPNRKPLPGPPSGTVTLLDVFTDNGATFASVLVDADSYNVQPGDSFGVSYRLDAINGRCVQLRRGANAFALCIGASTQT